MASIKAKALCIFRYENKSLLSFGYDPSKKEHYLRPIGGSIEFEETSLQAIEREVLEEINQQITHPKLLGVLENLFSFDGQQGHEVVFVYEAEFVDPTLYSQTKINGYESDGSTYIAQWMTLQQLVSEQYPVYPKGIEQWLFANRQPNL
ncbi:NUDIX hydrolase [Acinetobacter ursingii]|uniref:NUDIX hydrolase n=1 Tax=Acinetobacter ursingii TaxID=108980 RepID=UPI0021CE3592|nr:NUDIX domain-containing protein [Acinetobacter ursingii]MCU4358736.1 NUDIX domain-containing protein [Acinetobacter ursingii]MEC8057579.1 NUDIX domain-containing protein [Pseudomonadota bacterium]